MLDSVLIVEDDLVIAMGVEEALADAGYHVCGVAVSEDEARSMGAKHQPNAAVVDVNLRPGDGRKVARHLCDRYRTTVLLATGEDPATLHGFGASAVLAKPYDPACVALALTTAKHLAAGIDPGALPNRVTALSV